MKTKDFKYIYGPVPSWRLGSSLGIDPISKGKRFAHLIAFIASLVRQKILVAKEKYLFPLLKL